MYVLKTKQLAEDQDNEKNKQKPERFVKRISREDSTGPVVAGETSEPGHKRDLSELPDGTCISPKRMVRRRDETRCSAVRDAEYIGSFSVVGDDQTSRAEYVRKQLVEMRNVNKSKPVLLVISLSGIKVCSSDGESVYMAHALKRISYATCDPEFWQFSFLAREPKGHTSIQYCHAFVTKSPEEAEELNTIVGNAFKMAYTYQRQNGENSQPSFNDLIEKQIETQKEEFEELSRQQQDHLAKRLSQISTPTIEERVKERRERRKKELQELEKERDTQILQGKDRTSWAKHIAGKTKHRSVVDEAPRSRLYSSQLSTGSGTGSSCDISQSQHYNSISALREAFNSGELRSYGSPVMTLKETIDNHFSGSNQMNSPNAHGTGGGTALRNSLNVSPENYLQPVASTSSSPEIDPQTNGEQSKHKIANRPLPATPDHEKKSNGKLKGHKSRTRSSSGHRSSSGQRSSSGPRSSPDSSSKSSEGSPQMNGQESQPVTRRVRPMSGRYQNDSPSTGSFVDLTETGVYQGPPTPKRYDSLKKIDGSDYPIEEELSNAPWYQAGIPREIALEILAQEEIGSFIVRDSTTHPNCYALSVKVPKFDNPMGISHYLIMRTPRGGVKLKGLDKEWPNLTALVTHHTVMPEMLPCTLRLPRNSNNPAFKDTDKDDKDEEDEDYSKLSDFTSMMNELKM